MARIYPVYDLPEDLRTILDRHIRNPGCRPTHVVEAMYEEGQALLRTVFPDAVIISEMKDNVHTGFHYALICRK